MWTTRVLLAGLLCSIGPFTFAQLQHNTWYFGSHAGLSFSGGAPQAFSGCMINAFEGSASISDANGMGLFYTNCVTVFDRSNVPMSNGTDLGGDVSSCQGVVIAASLWTKRISPTTSAAYWPKP
jgi:hypothetical protein